MACPRCRTALRWDLSHALHTSAKNLPEVAVNKGVAGNIPPTTGQPLGDTWEKEQLHHLERILQPPLPSAPTVPLPIKSRVDQPLTQVAKYHWSVEHLREKNARSLQDADSLLTPSWILLAMSVTMTTCGTMLWVWSWMMERRELWTVGMPIALAGQISLLLGLVWQLDRLRRQNRQTSVQLERVDKQLRDLKRQRIDQGGQSPKQGTHRSTTAPASTSPLRTEN